MRAELAEIDENLVRHELHYIDRGEKLDRRKVIYEELHPETKAGVAGGKASGIARGTTAESAIVQTSFTVDTANKTGISERTIRAEVQLARGLTPEAKEAVVKADVPKADALILVKQTPEIQNVNLFTNIKT